MKRTKTVFHTDEIAHLWAHQTQEYATNSSRNFSFHGIHLYSYHTVIASLVKNNTVALLANESWSNTTNKHQRDAYSATTHLHQFRVKNWVVGLDGKIDHKDNLKDYKQRIADLESKFLKSKNRALGYDRQLIDLIAEANSYATVFGLITRFKSNIKPEIAQAIIEKGEELRNKSNLAREAKWAEYRRKQDEERGIKEAEAPVNFQKWLNGETYEKNWPFDYLNNKAYGRVVENNLQTTQGAVVPIEHIKRITPLIRKIIDRGETFVPNGHTIHLGPYQVDSIDSDGTLRAGCHTFEKAEVLRILDICNK